MKKIIWSLVGVVVLVSCAYFLTVDHSGRTDSSGCHYNRKTGQYHCHIVDPR